MKNKKIWLSILIVIIVLAVAETTVYIIMHKNNNIGNEEYSGEEVNNNQQEEYNEKNEEVNLEGLQKIDVNKINMSKDFVGKYPLDDLEKLKKADEVDFNSISGNNITYTNNSLQIKEYNIKYTNFNDIYFHECDCVGTSFFILYNDKLIILDGPSGGNITEIKSNIYKTIDSVYAIYVHSQLCGALYRYIGHSTDGKYYDMQTAKEVNTKQKYYYYDYLTSDRKYTLNNLSIKVKMIIYDIENINMIIDENNHLYVDGATKKLNKKVKTVYYRQTNCENDEYSCDAGYVYIKFEDGTFYEDLDGKKAIESYDGILY